MIDKIDPLDRALGLLATDTEDLKKVGEEFSAFLNFAEAQGQGKSVTHKNRDAINFANRWAAIPPSEHRELKEQFGESFNPIFRAALSLTAFDLTSSFNKS